MIHPRGIRAHAGVAGSPSCGSRVACASLLASSCGNSISPWRSGSIGGHFRNNRIISLPKDRQKHETPGGELHGRTWRAGLGRHEHLQSDSRFKQTPCAGRPPKHMILARALPHRSYAHNGRNRPHCF